MAGKLHGESVAILAADGVEEIELMRPWAQLHRAGARPVVVSMTRGAVRAQHDGRAAHAISVDAEVGTTPPERYAGLVIPGGAGHADRLCADAEMVRFIKAFFQARKPVAAFGEGLAVVLEAEDIEGRRLATAATLTGDVQLAGGHCVDGAVATDGNLITGRRRDGLDAFTQRVIDELLRRRRGKRRRTAAAMLQRWLPPRRGRRTH